MPDPTDPLVVENATLRRDYHSLQQQLQEARSKLLEATLKAQYRTIRTPWYEYLKWFLTHPWMNAAVNCAMIYASIVFVWSAHVYTTTGNPDATYNSWLERHRNHDFADHRAPVKVQRRHTETPDADADDDADSR